MGIKFSIIFPSRGRRLLLMNVLATIGLYTKHLDAIEVLIAVDNDDEEMHSKRLDGFEDRHSDMNLKFYVFDRSIHFTKDYINPLARMAKGRFIMVINDDSEFTTPNWDILLYEALDARCKELGDDIIYGMVRDGLDNPTFSCWPIQSKEAVKVAGQFFNEKHYIWGTDQAISGVYKKLSKKLNEQRMVKIDNVVIDHNSGHTGRREFDKNFEYFRAICDALPEPYTVSDEDADAQKLYEYIITKRKMHECIDNGHNR